MQKKLNVLIVEDEPLIKIFLKRVVLSLGHTIIGTPSDGESALQLIKMHDVDLIFMDINIDGAIDGINVVKMLNSSQNPLIYFISAYSDAQTISEALETKADNYLIKPIKEKDIFIALSLAVKRKMNIKYNRDIYLSSKLYYSQKKQELFQNEKMIKLTKIEKKIIDVLVKNLNSNVPSTIFIEEVWEGKEITISTIRSALFSLRKKIPSLKLETNFGRGYSLLSEN